MDEFKENLDRWDGKLLLTQFATIFQVNDVMSDVLCLSQAYEWSVMINMIIFQQGKTIQDIMYEMSEKSSRDTFQKAEKAIKKSYQALLGFYVMIFAF